MTPPRVYAEWLPLLDKFSEGDDTVVALLCNGEIEWTNVVAERWTRHVSRCLTTRLQALSKHLQVGLDRARGDYFAISNVLLTARRGVVPLRAFVRLPACPADVQGHLESELDRWVSATQSSLEGHAHGIRDDQGRLLKTLRDNPLTGAASVAPVPQSAGEGIDDAAPFQRRRRVLL